MTFRVERPRDGRTPRGACPEPGCGRHFWHTDPGGRHIIVVGVMPEDVEREPWHPVGVKP